MSAERVSVILLSLLLLTAATDGFAPPAVADAAAAQHTPQAGLLEEDLDCLGVTLPIQRRLLLARARVLVEERQKMKSRHQ